MNDNRQTNLGFVANLQRNILIDEEIAAERDYVQVFGTSYANRNPKLDAVYARKINRHRRMMRRRARTVKILFFIMFAIFFVKYYPVFRYRANMKKIRQEIIKTEVIDGIALRPMDFYKDKAYVLTIKSKIKNDGNTRYKVRVLTRSTTTGDKYGERSQKAAD